MSLNGFGNGQCVTDFHVSLYAQSPFIAHMVLHQRCSPPTTDKTVQDASNGIQMDILRSKFSKENAWDTRGAELGRDEILKQMISAVVSGNFDVIFNPIAFQEVKGVPYEGRADVLHRVGARQYKVKVVTSSKTLRPQMVMKALFCQHVLSLMLGKDGNQNIGDFDAHFFGKFNNSREHM